MIKILLLLLISMQLTAQRLKINDQNTTAFESSFKRNGRIWVSYDPKNAQIQTFTPLDSVYSCNGKYLDLITNYEHKLNIERIYFGDKWAEISSVTPRGDRTSEHMLFWVMAACFDGQFIYCPCGAVFKITSKSTGKW